MSRPLLAVPAALALLLGSLSGFVLSASLAACGGDDTRLLVTGIEPDRGDTQGETYVRIKGNRFTTGGPRSVKVYFGDHQGRVVRFESDNEIVVQPPGGKPNEVVDVVVEFRPGGTLKIPSGYRYFERKQGGMQVDDLNISRSGSGKK